MFASWANGFFEEGGFARAFPWLENAPPLVDQLQAGPRQTIVVQDREPLFRPKLDATHRTAQASFSNSAAANVGAPPRSSRHFTNLAELQGSSLGPYEVHRRTTEGSKMSPWEDKMSFQGVFTQAHCFWGGAVQSFLKRRWVLLRGLRVSEDCL